MSKQIAFTSNNRNVQKSFSWRTLGPGILLASAAIGGSHLISSTQAGASYGWQLAGLIVITNLLKYPFFRFGTDYVYGTGESLIAGYYKKSKIYLGIYLLLSMFASVVGTGAVALLCAAILGLMLPDSLGLSPIVLSIIVMIVSWLVLVAGHYKLLDSVNKWIIVALTFGSIIAVVVAAGKPSIMTTDFVPTSPWNLATLGFLVALMGWMPAPMEFSAINSMWISAKIKAENTTYRQGLIDFNVGYSVSTILALVFLGLGVFVQYGTGQEIQTAGSDYVGQLIDMYTGTIGEWSRFLVAFVAFMCMFGTTLTSADGTARANSECLRLFKGKENITDKQMFFWTSYAIFGGLIIILFFTGQLGSMLKFAMIAAFIAAPIVGGLNYVLIKGHKKLSTLMNVWAILGLIFLTGIALLFIANLLGFFI